MDTQNVVYPHHGVLVSHKKKQSNDADYNMDESWKLITGKKLNTKGYILYDSIYN